MLSIGWVVFWKAVILGAWAGVLEVWGSKKARHRAKGIELRLNKKTGIYVPFDPYERVEHYARIAQNTFYVLMFLSVPATLWMIGYFDT